MGFFGMIVKPEVAETVEVPSGWRLQLCTAALKPGQSKTKATSAQEGTSLWIQTEGNIGDIKFCLGTFRIAGTVPVHLSGWFEQDPFDETSSDMSVPTNSEESEDYANLEELDHEDSEEDNGGEQEEQQSVEKVKAAAIADVTKVNATVEGKTGQTKESQVSNKRPRTEESSEIAEGVAGEDMNLEEEEGKCTEAAVETSEENSKLTKNARKRLRKQENKRKAEETKRRLQEAFASDEADETETGPPVGVPLKKPLTRTVKGGLKIVDTTLGDGKTATPGKTVKILYEGSFPDGRVFDKNFNRKKPLTFRVGLKSVIPGMDRGIEGMMVGGSRELYIPSALGYGSRGTGPIPANQDLVFRIELIEVK